MSAAANENDDESVSFNTTLALETFGEGGVAWVETRPSKIRHGMDRMIGKLGEDEPRGFGRTFSEAWRGYRWDRALKAAETYSADLYFAATASVQDGNLDGLRDILSLIDDDACGSEVET